METEERKKLKLTTKVGLGAIKAVINLYDFVSLPAYLIAQRPWAKRDRINAIRAKQEDPSDPYSSWVRIGKEPDLLIKDCKTIDELMRLCIKHYGNTRCMGHRRLLKEEKSVQPDGKIHYKRQLAPEYSWISYNQVNQRLDSIVRGLLLAGVKSGDKMIIFMETRMEWMLTAQAMYRMGVTLATVYATLGDEGVIHVMNEVGSTHILTSSELLPKVAKIRSKLPFLKKVIYCEDHLEVYDPSPLKLTDSGLELIQFTNLEENGDKADPSLVGTPPKQDDIALIMYTSGSTGVPKGVMAQHINFIGAVRGLNTVLSQIVQGTGEVNIAYLPLAHNLEFTVEHLDFSLGIGIGYSSPLTMMDTSAGIIEGTRGDITILKPAALVGVPLIMDRLRKGISDKMQMSGEFVESLFTYLMQYKGEWRMKGYNTPILNYLICRKIKASLGGNIVAMFSGGAPLSPLTHEFTRNCLDVNVMQGYGATETTAVSTLMDIDDYTVSKVGAPCFGAKIRLIDWEEGGYRPTDKPYPRGEVLVSGPSITTGYYQQEEVTKEAFKVDGDGVLWFYSGDIGEIYPDGTLKIIDRKKDLLKLAFGEYISLGKVESELKGSDYVDNIMVYGAPMENFIIALVIPNPVKVRALSVKHGLKEDLSFEELYRNKGIVKDVLKNIIMHAKEAGLHKMEIPKAIKLCCEEWNPDSGSGPGGGFLTAGLKVRRKPITEFYASDIARMYRETLDEANNNIGSNGKIVN